MFRRWQRAGVWQQIVTDLQARADAAGLITWQVSVDSTVAIAVDTALLEEDTEEPGGLPPTPGL